MVVVETRRKLSNVVCALSAKEAELAQPLLLAAMQPQSRTRDKAFVQVILNCID